MGGRFGWVVDGFSLGPLSRGDGGGEETNVRARTAGSAQFFYVICYMYIEQWGFRCFMLQDHRERSPDPRCPGQTRDR